MRSRLIAIGVAVAAETTPLERGARRVKRYAAGIPLIQGGSLELGAQGLPGRD